ncbi:MAG TPA: macro domain-containing protein, partial [Roseimicrobium sp.]|nr:macro domain-containing protein [Roseimicrobium sp.]
IKKRGGYGPFRELSKMGWIPLGGAVITGPGRLPFKAIIHVAGINLCWLTSERAVRDCVRNALALAKEKGFRSIALPMIGAGTGGMSPDKALAAMQEECNRSSFEGEVRLVRFVPGGK